MQPARYRLHRVAMRVFLGVGLLLLLGGTALADKGSGREVRIEDDCDPATFNAALGPGACVGNGDTTLNEFNAELQRNKSVGAWRFNSDQFNMDAGQTLTLQSRAGETHTFTKVNAFGGGFVQSLNDLSGNPTPAPECLAGAGPTSLFITAGSRVTIATGNGTLYPAGTYRFQCCIHPWMRTVATIRSR